jgi:hypothetical protein
MNILYIYLHNTGINLGSWLPLESEIIHETPLSIFIEFNFPTFTHLSNLKKISKSSTFIHYPTF